MIGWPNGMASDICRALAYAALASVLVFPARSSYRSALASARSARSASISATVRRLVSSISTVTSWPALRSASAAWLMSHVLAALVA